MIYDLYQTGQIILKFQSLGYRERLSLLSHAWITTTALYIYKLVLALVMKSTIFGMGFKSDK